MCENKMEMEINADTVLQKLNQYMFFSLTYKQALYMFNNSTTECTKGKQLAVYPYRNSCKMSESICTRTRSSTPLPPSAAKGGGTNQPRRKNVWFDISESSELSAADIRATRQKSTNPVMGKSTRAHTRRACSCLPMTGNLLIHGQHTWHHMHC